MSIFDRIRDSIFGRPDAAPTLNKISGSPQVAPTRPAAAVAAQSGMPQQPSPSPAINPMAPERHVAPEAIDVEQVLIDRMEAKGNPQLNWRTSVADLMRLLDLDPSLENRRELARELGYTGAADGSAEMNIWLYKAVMRGLEQNGGRVPREMAD